MSEPEKLFTREFLALNGVAFLAFCNMVVFFQFYVYLQTLPIGSQWYGFLIALFSITGLILRPLISPFFHTGNARLGMMISTIGVIVSLLGYNLAQDFWSMFLVRAIHGIAYVMLGVALNAALVGLIPPSRSGQAFGLVTVITLLPLAILPPLLKILAYRLGGFIPVLNAAALLMLLIFPLLLAIKTAPGRSPGTDGQRLTIRDLTENLKDRRVVILLLLMLLLYTGFTPVFFFLEGYAKMTAIPNPGLFFTLSTMTEISIRLFAGSLFDRMNKPLLITGSLVTIGLGYLALAYLSGAIMLYCLGIFLGLGWGVVMPVLNGLMFDVSPPQLKGLNTNLGVQMFQGGFFLGPFIGGMILVQGDYRELFSLCAVFAFVSVALTPLLVTRRKEILTP
jgi:predicted MFS family arabinose efflux permease